MAFFWLIISFCCFLLFLHPYIFYPLTLRLMGEQAVKQNPNLPLPTATLVFSAYNEEMSLPDKLRNLEAIKAIHPNIQVLAYSDMSDDRTKEILLSRPDLLTLVPSNERTGKATGMRRMVDEASGDICIFTDANVALDPKSVAPLLAYFRDPSVGGVAGTLRYINEGEGTTASVGGLYWRLEEHIKALESRCGSIMGADGSIFATRRAIYPEVPAHLLDDMTVSTSVMFHGLRLISAPDVIAYEKTTTSSSDEFRRKKRIACRAFNTHVFLWPKIREHFSSVGVYKYVSHKVLRWFGAPILAGGLLSFTVALILLDQHLLAMLLWVAGIAAYLVGRMRDVPLLSPIAEIMVSIAATFIGIVESLQGRTYQIWAPAKSRD